MKDEILRSVKKYINEKETKFVAGETYIPSSGATWSADDVSQVVDTVLERWFGGKVSYEFERLLANFVKQRHVSLCNSGSSANLLALSALTSKELGERRLRPGDEVITVAAGFPTTVNPIVQNGLIPVFIDINLPQYNALPHVIEEAITEKTKAIFIAHTLGNPFKARDVRDLCDRNELWYVADCCDALAAENHGQPLSVWADVSTFSFYPAHHISTMEGGAVATDNPRLNKIIRSFRDWGKSCFPSGVKVNVGEKIKNIEDVERGDYVLTHEGKMSVVSDLTGKTYTGEMLTIKAGNAKKIRVTENHPFFILRDNKYQWVESQDLTNGDYLLESLPQEENHAPDEFYFEYETQYQKKSELIKNSPELMRLIGYWLAEGNLASGKKGGRMYKKGNNYLFHRVDFSFHKDEIEYINDVSEIMKMVFGSSGTVKRVGKNGAFISFKSRKGYEFFNKFFGQKSYLKSMPNYFVNLKAELLSELIKGYWRGDGSSSKQGYSFGTTSEILFHQLRRILLRFGIYGSYSERNVNQHVSSIVNGKEIKAKRTMYNLYFYGQSAVYMGVLLGENAYVKKPNTSLQKSFFVDSRYIAYPVETVERKYVKKETVYNIEVEDFHSYHAEFFAVHNCWCPPGKDDTCGKRYNWQLGNLPEGFDHKYIFSEVGYNLKSSDLHAALGINQVKRINQYIDARRDNWNFYRQAFQEWEEFFILPEPNPFSKPSWFGFMLTVRDKSPFSRRELVSFLEENRIGSRMLFAGNLAKQPAYQDVNYRISGTLHKTDRVMNNGFWIGVYQGITPPMREYVAGKMKEFIDEKLRKN